MISFDLSEEQKALRQTAREFAQKEMIPVAAKYDESGEFPWPVFQKGFELGLLNLGLPTECGGLGLSNLDILVVNEELGAGCTGILTSMMVNDLAIKPIVLAGNEGQKKKWLIPFSEQLQFGSFALTEPGAGSDVAGMSTSVKKAGSDYILI
ncbi:MAG: acyl-CoA dehydrogenase family protein, partial [Deltaproteobacteria bacterium]|nr:acyl-CoA dehydrogenase family protein [Deltaproteobacteria bacterium]